MGKAKKHRIELCVDFDADNSEEYCSWEIWDPDENMIATGGGFYLELLEDALKYAGAHNIDVDFGEWKFMETEESMREYMRLGKEEGYDE